MARQRTGSGKKQAENAEDFAGAILERLTLQSTLALTDSIFAHQGLPEAMSDRNPLLEILLRSSISEMHASRPAAIRTITCFICVCARDNLLSHLAPPRGVIIQRLLKF